MIEQWCPVEGYENYSVSTEGRVLSKACLDSYGRDYDKWIKYYDYHKDPYWVPLNFEVIIPPRIYRHGTIQIAQTARS